VGCDERQGRRALERDQPDADGTRLAAGMARLREHERGELAVLDRRARVGEERGERFRGSA
jgi:hypothetical protein